MKKLVLSSVAVAAMFALAGSANAQIKIGVAGPITGPNAAFGAQLKNGAEQAAADINAKGGINGQKIELVFGDDVSDPKQGVSVANKMVGDGVKFVSQVAMEGVAKPIPNYPEGVAASMIKNDLDWAAENRDRIIKEWQRRYDAKSAK